MSHIHTPASESYFSLTQVPQAILGKEWSTTGSETTEYNDCSMQHSVFIPLVLRSHQGQNKLSKPRSYFTKPTFCCTYTCLVLANNRVLSYGHAQMMDCIPTPWEGSYTVQLWTFICIVLNLLCTARTWQVSNITCILYLYKVKCYFKGVPSQHLGPPIFLPGQNTVNSHSEASEHPK